MTGISGTFIVHGKVTDQVFVPDEPMPDIEGRAALVVYPVADPRPRALRTRSVLDFIGKAFDPRSAKDIDAQLREERDAWNDL